MKPTHAQLVQLHTAALAIEEAVIADLHLDLSPRRTGQNRESTRAPGYLRAREVVRRHPEQWARWQRAEALRWQIALSQRLSLSVMTAGYGDLAEDIASSSLESLFIAAITWDPQRGRFSTHANQWMFAGVTRAAERTTTVRQSGHLAQIRRGMYRHDVVIRGATQRTVDMARGFRVVSLDAPAPGTAATLGDTLAGEGIPADDAAVTTILRDELHQALDIVARREPRAHALLRRRYGLDDGEDRTLKAVGAEMGVSRERARQIERAGLDLLQHHMGAVSLAASPYVGRRGHGVQHG